MPASPPGTKDGLPRRGDCNGSKDLDFCYLLLRRSTEPIREGVESKKGERREFWGGRSLMGRSGSTRGGEEKKRAFAEATSADRSLLDAGSSKKAGGEGISLQERRESLSDHGKCVQKPGKKKKERRSCPPIWGGKERATNRSIRR